MHATNLTAGTTRLEPLPPDRAKQLFDMMAEAAHDSSKALALDDDGRVTAVISADDAAEQHVLHDLDVHA